MTGWLGGASRLELGFRPAFSMDRHAFQEYMGMENLRKTEEYLRARLPQNEYFRSKLPKFEILKMEMGQSNSTAHDTSILKTSKTLIKHEYYAHCNLSVFRTHSKDARPTARTKMGNRRHWPPSCPDRRIVILSTPGVIT